MSEIELRKLKLYLSGLIKKQANYKENLELTRTSVEQLKLLQAII